MKIVFVMKWDQKCIGNGDFTEILKLWNNYMLIRIKCSLHEYCVPVLFIGLFNLQVLHI